MISVLKRRGFAVGRSVRRASRQLRCSEAGTCLVSKNQEGTLYRREPNECFCELPRARKPQVK